MPAYQRLNLASLLLLISLIISDIFSDVGWIWYSFLMFLYVAICALGSFVISLRFYTSAKCRGQGTGNEIALTFDDGPVAGRTEKVLEILSQYNTKATFFCIGNRVRTNETLVQKIHEEGHLVGNHSYYHKPSFAFQSESRVMKELVLTDEAIVKILQKRPRFFRPPYGVTNPMIANAVAKSTFSTVGWSLRSFDTIIRDTEKLYNRVTRSLKPGDIVLFHDHSESMISILPAFLEYAKKKGLKIVRLDQLLNESPYC